MGNFINVGKSNCHASCVVAKPAFRAAREKHKSVCNKTWLPSTDKKFLPTVCFDLEPKQRTPMKNASHPSFAFGVHFVLDKDLEETIRSKWSGARTPPLAIETMFCLFKWSDPRWLGLTNLNGGAIRMQRQTSARSLWTGEISLHIIMHLEPQTICVKQT